MKRTYQRMSDGTTRLKDAGENKAAVIALSKSITAIKEQIKNADMAQRAIAGADRSPASIDIEDVSGLGIALDKIQKEAKRAESVLTKLSRAVK